MTKNDIAKLVIKRMKDLNFLVSEKQIMRDCKRSTKAECEAALTEIWPNWKEEI